METKPQVGLIVALGVLAIMAGGAYYFIAAVIDKLNGVNSDLGKAIVAGGVTVATASIILVVGKVWEQKVKIQQDTREKKIPVYEKQIETFFSVIFAQKVGAEPVPPHEIQKAFLAFTEKLIIWGSPNVIKAWTAFRLHDWDGSEPTIGFVKLEAFIRAIRSDLGCSNYSLPNGDLTRLFVNDYPGTTTPQKSMTNQQQGL